MATLSAPTLLATFNDSGALASSSKTAPNHVSLSEVEGSEGRLAVATVQGNGVWTYELTTSRPTTSFTVAPTTLFSSRAISYTPSRQDKGKGRAVDQDDADSQTKARITAVGVSQGQKKAAEGELWIWEGEDGSAKQVINLPHVPAHLLYTTNSDYPILAVSLKGQVTRLDDGFEVADTSAIPSVSEGSIVTVALMPGKDAALPVFVAVTSTGKIWSAKLHSNAQPLKFNVERSFEVKGTIVAASISSRGHVIAIDQHNHLYARHLSLKSEVESQAGLTFAHPQTHPSVLSLPSSRPLALFPTTRPESSLLLALPTSDMPAILSNTPLTASTGASMIRLAYLGQRSSGAATIGVTISLPNEQGATSRTVIYVAEAAIPEAGVGLNILLGGEAKAREFFLRPQSAALTAAPAADGVVEKLHASLSAGALPEAESILSAWLAKQDTAKRAISDSTVRDILRTVLGQALTADAPATTTGPTLMKRKGPHAADVVQALLQRKVVNDDMWPGGVIKNGLLPLADWDNITLALQTMTTVSSATLVALIKAALQSDSPGSAAPRPETLLWTILSLPVPDPAYRSELKRSLSVEQANEVLSILLGWAESHAAQPAGDLRTWAGELSSAQPLSNGHSASADVLPSISSVVAHSSLLLDSHLPLFLNHPPAHLLIERMQAALSPLVAQQDNFRRLRAPVDAVLVLAMREKRKREEEAARKDFLRPHAHGGKRAKVGSSDSMALPDEVVNSYRVEDYVF